MRAAHAPLLQGDVEAEAAVPTPPSPSPPSPPHGGARVVKPRAVLFSVSVCLVVLAAPLFRHTAERRGAALCALAATLWASDAVPPFAVALAVPPLATLLQLPPALLPKERAAYNLASMSDPVVYLLLCSFAIGRALASHGLDARLASALLRPASLVGPRTLVAVLLAVTCALSALVGNACAAVGVLLLVTPLVRACPRESRFPQCVVAAVALGANVGGMLTPVSSAQNAVALEVLGKQGCSVSFAQWLAVAAPLCALYLLAAFLLLFRYWRPTLTQLPALPEREGCTGPLPPAARAVMAITLATVVSWALFPHLQPYFGDVGVLSLLPIVVLFASGLLTAPDFNHLDWSVIVLLGGGACLGRAAATSGLLGHLAAVLRAALADWTPPAASAVYSGAALLASTFVSHTVAAITFLPLVADAAAPRSVAATVMAAVICDTGACMLPVSSLPNMLAFASADVHGVPYLAAPDFLKTGAAFALVVFATTSTAGCALATWVLRDACPAAAPTV